MSRLKEKYNKEIIPYLKQKLGCTNSMAIPKMVKAVINVGAGQALKDEKFIETIVNNLTRISGQKPVLTKAKQSISAFKIRQGMKIGAKVTMRGARLYDFVDKLVNITLARVHDFQGLDKKSVDQKGNLTIGFKEHIVFPEIRSDEVERIHGLEVTIASNAKSQADGVELYTALGFPFKQK